MTVNKLSEKLREVANDELHGTAEVLAIKAAIKLDAQERTIRHALEELQCDRVDQTERILKEALGL